MKLNQVRTIAESQGIHPGQLPQSVLNKLLQRNAENTDCFSNTISSELNQAGAISSLGGLTLAVKITNMEGLALLEELTLRGMHLPIILIAGRDSVLLTVSSLEAGSIENSPVQDDKISLLACINQALQKNSKLQNKSYESISTSARLATLTTREKQVMLKVLEGLTSKEIATHLGISFRTVENYRARIMNKTGCANVLELSRIATYQVAQ